MKKFQLNFFAVVLACSAALVACIDRSPKFSIEDGKAVYKKNCLPCHNYNAFNTQYRPALHEMLSWSSQTIEKKMNYISTDSLHQVVSNGLDATEIGVLKNFLNEYEGIDPG